MKRVDRGAERHVARMGAPQSKKDLIRTCAESRKYIEQRKLADAAEIESVWPVRGERAPFHEWMYCWAQLCRFGERGNQKAAASDGLKESVAALILAREPVRIGIAGRSVDVTFRSLTALILLARHDLARRDAERALTRLSEMAAATEQRKAEGKMRPAAARRRFRWFRRLHDSLHDDLLHHTQVVLANALTPDGSDVPADSAAAWLEKHAPYWRRITPDDEQLLFWALFASGPGRISAMGEVPKEEGDSNERAWREDIGYWSLLAWFFREHAIAPAQLKVDLAQFMTLIRVGTPYFPPPPKSTDRVH